MDMTPAKISSKDKRLDKDNVFAANQRTNLLRSAAVYGANASGKSNLVKAVGLMRDFVPSSASERRATEPIDMQEYRLDMETENHPSLFEVVFISSGKQYRYGVEVSRKRVESEWLFWVPTVKEARLFVWERDEINVSKRSGEESKGLQGKTRPNALFLSVVGQFNGPISMETLHRRHDHEGRPVDHAFFDLDEDESDGTQKLFSVAVHVLDALNKGGIVVVDELDARLHPLITRTLVHMFHTTESNKANAQLIFTTHDTNLLDKTVLRRDQIWVAEKDLQGRSHLTSLVEYKVRNDASYEKEYLRGKYGAIPFINVVKLFREDTDA